MNDPLYAPGETVRVGLSGCGVISRIYTDDRHPLARYDVTVKGQIWWRQISEAELGPISANDEGEAR